MSFNIELVTAIKWNDEAFKRLVLPPDQKDLIRGLVEAQTANSFEFDDYVEGKGRGLVINLFGLWGLASRINNLTYYRSTGSGQDALCRGDQRT